MNDSILIFDKIKLKTNKVKAKPAQYKIILNATKKGLADDTKIEISEIK